MAAAKPKNSWEPWVNNTLLGADKNLKAGGIFGQADGKAWFQKDVPMTPAEASAVVKGLKDSSLFTSSDDAKRVSIMVGGAKFLYLKCTDGELTARKGPTTLLAKLSNKALVVALTKDGANPGNVTAHTKLVDALKAKTF